MLEAKSNNEFYDTLSDSGLIMIGSRFKRLYELLFNQVQELYHLNNKNFKTVWFYTLFVLRRDGEMDLKTLANKMSIKPPSLSTTIKDLEKNDCIEIKSHESDSRYKIIAISPHGIELLNKIIPEISFVNEVLEQLFGEDKSTILARLSYLENELKRQPLSQRISQSITITPYHRQYKDALSELFGQWELKYYGLKEHSEYDKRHLRDPEQYIIKPGGQVFFALDGNEVIGTIALVQLSDKVAEISKIYVKEDCQKRGVGKLMMQTVIDLAREKNYSELLIVTNKTLKPAIKLYKKFGFIEIETPQEAKDKYGEIANLSFKLYL